MKFNWGTGITIAIIAFMAFIVTLVVNVNSHKYELVSDTYYEDEMQFNDKYNAIQLASKNGFRWNQEQVDNALVVELPEQLKGDISSARITLRHPSKSEGDIEVPWKNGSENISINLNGLSTGMIYAAALEIEANGEKYLIEKQLRIP